MFAKTVRISWLPVAAVVLLLVNIICWILLGIPYLKTVLIQIGALAGLAILSARYNREGEFRYGSVTAGAVVLAIDLFLFAFCSFSTVCEGTSHVLVNHSFNRNNPDLWNYKISRVVDEPGLHFVSLRESVVVVPMFEKKPYFVPITTEFGSNFVVAAWITVESPLRAFKLAYQGNFSERLKGLIYNTTSRPVKALLSNPNENHFGSQRQIAQQLAEKLYLQGIRLEAFAAAPALLPVKR